MTEPAPLKTYKREVAMIGFVAHWALVFLAVFRPEVAVMAGKMAELMLAPVYLVLSAAFGYDAWTKQSGIK
jgi:hypothetical protein